MTSQTLLLVLAVLAVAAALVTLLHRSLLRGDGLPAVEGVEIGHLHDRIRRIAESEERYRALVEATTELIVQRDALGRITFANAGFGRLVGAEAFALVGSTVEVPCLERGPMAEGPDGVRRIERRLAPVNGPPRWFSFIEMPVVGPDGQTQWLHAGSDITGRIEAARSLDEALSRAEAANVAKSRFLATVSHEFRTPLNGILGMADLVLDTGLDAEQRTYVEAVRTSGKALLSLIDGILDFSRIESGRLDLAAAPFDLASLAEGVVELLAPRAQDKGIEIALDSAADFSGPVIGDADRVRQILVNLAGNAVKFTQAGGVGIEIGRMDDGVALTVRDTGPGIPRERIPHLFEEFEQGDGSASRRHEGTGLGLAITRRLVARMGGRIETASTVGQGSCFTVILPLVAAPAEPTEPVALPGRRVLIVAESPFQAPYLARRLTRVGAEAVVVATEVDGLAALAAQPFDAVIADRSLGDATVRTLARAAKGQGVRCSLVLLSPFDRREFGSAGAAGFDGYLIKPVRARSLFDRLLAPRPASATTDAPAVTVSTEPPFRSGARVLLAEDNPINALLATKALERLGATVVPARDGLEAVALFESGSFDLALVDIRMPGLDGLETARRIRALEAARGGARLHLVALTANAGRDDERAAHAAGFDGFLPKPLNLRALPALLERRSAAA